MPAAVFLDLTSLSLSLSSGSGISKELIARRTFRGAGKGAGVPSHGGRCVDSAMHRYEQGENVNDMAVEQRCKYGNLGSEGIGVGQRTSSTNSS